MVQAGSQAVRPSIKTPLPGPKAAAVLERDRRFLSPSYTRVYPLVVRRGKGVWVEDVDGNLFLDCTAGIAVTATGHCHPDVVEALKDQTRLFLHMSGTDFHYEAQVELAERLSALAPGKGDKRSFFSNSGAEAVECALKLARYHTRRQAIVAFEGGFHGRTYGAMSVSASRTIHKEGFFPLLPGAYHVPYGDTAAVERLLARTLPASEVAAVLVEPVLGEGGYEVPPEGFLPGLRALCDRIGALLIADEVQCGMGRTGRLFACRHWDVVPDVLCLAKGIASGMPLGVTLAPAELMAWKPGSHANTFGGNPLSCRAALATLRLLEGGLVENAAAMGERLLAGLRSLAERLPSRVQRPRGLGLMVAFDLPDAAARDRVVQEAFRRGLLLLGCGERAVRFCPALTIQAAEVDVALEIAAEAVAAASGL